MINMDITSKSAYKLLQQLESDSQLQSVEDTSILNDEQYPTSFESAITNLKDIIPLISAVTILRWNESKDSKILTQDQLNLNIDQLKTLILIKGGQKRVGSFLPPPSLSHNRISHFFSSSVLGGAAHYLLTNLGTVLR
jgi:hypothetical protein